MTHPQPSLSLVSDEIHSQQFSRTHTHTLNPLCAQKCTWAYVHICTGKCSDICASMRACTHTNRECFRSPLCSVFHFSSAVEVSLKLFLHPVLHVLAVRFWIKYHLLSTSSICLSLKFNSILRKVVTLF